MANGGLPQLPVISPELRLASPDLPASPHAVQISPELRLTSPHLPASPQAVKIGMHNGCAATAACLGGAAAAAHTALFATGMLCFTIGDVGSSLCQVITPDGVRWSDDGV